MIEFIGAIIVIFVVWLIGFVIVSGFNAACGMIFGGAIYLIVAAIDQVYYWVTGHHTELIPTPTNKKTRK